MLKCSINNCKNTEKNYRRIYSIPNKFKKILCGKHYDQLKRCGKILNRPHRNGNTFKIYKNYCKMFVYNQKNQIVESTIFDIQFLNQIQQHTWYLRKHRYTKGLPYVGTELLKKDSRTFLLLHYLILPHKNKFWVKHKNHNSLDNQLSNLYYQAWKPKSKKKFKKPKKCSVKSCNRQEPENRVYNSHKFNRHLCIKHFAQLKTHGKIKKTTPNINEIIIHNNECEMYLYDYKGNKIASTYFDIEFLEEVKKYKWHLCRRKHTNYVRTGEAFYLHQLCLPPKKGFISHHKDHDGLNNKSKNLVYETPLRNSQLRKDSLK